MRFDDKVYLQTCVSTEDEDYNLVETTEFVEIGKAKIIPNANASLRTAEDGKTYHYSLTVYIRKPSMIPNEGDIVKLYNNTAKTEKEYRVSGVTVLPKKYVRIYI